MTDSPRHQDHAPVLGAANVLLNCAVAAGWSDDTMLSLCCRFIDTLDERTRIDFRLFVAGICAEECDDSLADAAPYGHALPNRKRGLYDRQ